MSAWIHWPTFFKTLVVSSFILFLFIYLRVKRGTDCDFKKRKQSRLKKECRTGDILVVAYGSKRAKLVKVFTGSMWTHSAIIIRSENDVYTLEVARYSATQTGIVIKPLDQWLEKHNYCILGWRQYKGRDISLERLKSFVVDHEHVKVDLNVVSWLKSMWKSSYRHETKNTYYCSEFISHLLQDLKIMKTKYQPSGYKPWELLYGNMSLERPTDYGDPYLLIK